MSNLPGSWGWGNMPILPPPGPSMNPYAPTGSDSTGNNGGIQQGTPFFDTGSLVSSMPYNPGLNADGTMSVPSPWANQITAPSSSNFMRELFVRADRAANIISRANTTRRAEGIWNVVDYLPNQRLEKAGWVEQQVSWYLPNTTAVGDYGHGSSPSASITGKSATSRKVSVSWTQGMRSLDLNEGKQFWLRMVGLLHVTLKLEEEAMAFAMLLGTASMPTCLFDHDAASRETFSLDEAMKNFEEQFALFNKNSHSGLPTLTGEVRKRFGYLQTEQPDNFAMFVSPNSILLFLNTKTAAVNYEQSGPRSQALLKMQGTDNAPDLQGAKIYKCEHKVENAGRNILDRNIPIGWRVDQQEPFSKSAKVYFVGTDREEEISYASALKHITDHYFHLEADGGDIIADLVDGTKFNVVTFDDIRANGDLTRELVYGWFEHLSNNHPQVFKGFCEKFVNFKFEPAGLGPNDAVNVQDWAPNEVNKASFFSKSKSKRSRNVAGKVELKEKEKEKAKDPSNPSATPEPKNYDPIANAWDRVAPSGQETDRSVFFTIALGKIKGTDIGPALATACKNLEEHVLVEGQPVDVLYEFKGTRVEDPDKGDTSTKYFIQGQVLTSQDAKDNEDATVIAFYMPYPSLILQVATSIFDSRKKVCPLFLIPITFSNKDSPLLKYLFLVLSPAFNNAVVAFLEGIGYLTADEAKDCRLENPDLISDLTELKGNDDDVKFVDKLSGADLTNTDEKEELLKEWRILIGLAKAVPEPGTTGGGGGGGGGGTPVPRTRGTPATLPDNEEDDEWDNEPPTKHGRKFAEENRRPVSVIFDRDVPTIAEAVRVYFQLPFNKQTLSSLNLLRIPLPYRIVLLSPGVVYKSNAILVAPEKQGVATLAVSNTTTRYQKDEYQLQEFYGVEMNVLALVSDPHKITEFPCPYIEGVSRGDYPEFYKVSTKKGNEDLKFSLPEILSVKPGKKSYLFAGFSSWTHPQKSKWSTLIGEVVTCKKSPFHDRIEDAKGELFPFGAVIKNLMIAKKHDVQRKLNDFRDGNASNIGVMPLIAFALCRTTHHEISGINGSKTTHEDSSLFPASWGTGSRNYRTGTTGSNTHTVRRFTEIPY